MQTNSVTPSNGYSVNILDMQTGQNSKPSAAEEANRSQFQPVMQQPAAPQATSASQPMQQSMTPAGVGQKINITV